MFNELESFLIGNWKDAAALEQMMKSVRKKYGQMLLQMGEEAVNACRQRTHDSSLEAQWSINTLVITHANWSRDGNYPGGLWIDFVSLDLLTGDIDPPEAYVWATRKSGRDIVAEKQQLWLKLPSLFEESERNRLRRYEKDRNCLVGWTFSSKQELLGWLVRGDKQKLRNCIAEQVLLFSKMVPALDPILRSK